MATAKEIEDFEGVIERIVFKEVELDELKFAIRNFGKGTITPKQLKQKLIRYRGRIVKEVSNFLIYCLDRTQDNDQAPVNRKFTNLNQSDLANDQLRKENAEKNELLEVVAKRINALVSKAKKDASALGESLSLEDAIKIEIERVFLAVKVNEWFDMCGYDDYKFYIKLYNKLQALYRQKFGIDGKKPKKTKNTKVEQEIMRRKIAKLNLPEEVTSELIMFIVIRNNTEHDNYNLTPSDMEVAHNAFVRLFIYLITSNLDSKLLTGNEKSFYKNLRQYFSSRLERNPKFLEKIEKNLNLLFYNFL